MVFRMFVSDVVQSLSWQRFLLVQLGITWEGVRSTSLRGNKQG